MDRIHIEQRTGTFQFSIIVRVLLAKQRKIVVHEQCQCGSIEAHNNNGHQPWS
jgi:hypothetical protein